METALAIIGLVAAFALGIVLVRRGLVYVAAARESSNGTVWLVALGTTLFGCFLVSLPAIVYFMAEDEVEEEQIVREAASDAVNRMQRQEFLGALHLWSTSAGIANALGGLYEGIKRRETKDTAAREP